MNRTFLMELYHKFRYFYDFSKFKINWWFKGIGEVTDLSLYEFKKYSQNREDGMIQAIFNQLGTGDKFFVEIGCGDGVECNTKLLRLQGWNGILIDAENYENPEIRKHFVTMENVGEILSKYDVQKVFSFLSIDVDGNDYWILKSILELGYEPRVVVIEYNALLNPKESIITPYKQDYVWDRKTTNHGASLQAMCDLVKESYELIGIDNRKLNAFFVRKELIEGNFNIENKERLFKKVKNKGMGKQTGVKEQAWREK